MKYTIAATVALTLLCPAASRAGLINGSFEQPPVVPATVNYPGAIPGWKTTGSSFEIWGTGFNGVPAYHGNQFAELNAFSADTLFQDASGIAAGSQVGFQFAHRGRAGVDVMRLTITDLGADGLPGGVGANADTVLFTDLYADGTAAWGFYTNPAPIIALGNPVRFAYEAVSAVGGTTVGNFLDAADFGVGVGNSNVPEPASITLFGLTAVGGAIYGWRRRKQRIAA